MEPTSHLPFPLLIWGIFFVGSILLGVFYWIYDFFVKKPTKISYVSPLHIRWCVVVLSGGMFLAIPWGLQKTNALCWLPKDNPVEHLFWMSLVVEICLFCFFYLLLRFSFLRDGLRGKEAEKWQWKSFTRYFFKSFPLVLLVFLLWVPLLMALQKIGLPISIEFQPIMQLLMKGHVSVGSLCAIGFSAMVLGPICEEIFFRGILLRYFCSHTSLQASLWLSSIIFSMMHRHVTAFLPIVIMGYWLGWVYAKSQNLMVNIVVHGLFNAFSFIGAIVFAHCHAA